jgi:hypothetical protein
MMAIRPDRYGDAALGWNAEAEFYASQSLGKMQAERCISPVLATLPAGLRLRVTRTDAGRVERGRTNALAGVALARTTGKAGICGCISQS